MIFDDVKVHPALPVPKDVPEGHILLQNLESGLPYGSFEWYEWCPLSLVVQRSFNRCSDYDGSWTEGGWAVLRPIPEEDYVLVPSAPVGSRGKIKLRGDYVVVRQLVKVSFAMPVTEVLRFQAEVSVPLKGNGLRGRGRVFPQTRYKFRVWKEYASGKIVRHGGYSVLADSEEEARREVRRDVGGLVRAELIGAEAPSDGPEWEPVAWPAE